MNRLLLPLSWVFSGVVALRRYAYRVGWLKAERLAVPVIVVGNITVGGNGKTPFVIALARILQARGYAPGIVTRGYKGAMAGGQRLLKEDTDWRLCGDEALLIRRRTGLPVAVGKNRAAAAALLVKNGCDVILSDDGLQHYRLARDIEICMLNVSRGFSNGNLWFLPAGPLREPIPRMKECTFRVYSGGEKNKRSGKLSANSYSAHNQIIGFYPLGQPDGDLLSPDELRDALSGASATSVVALAGIAHPDSFFDELAELGVSPARCIALPDHGYLPPDEWKALRQAAVVMTEKDALKYEEKEGKRDAAVYVAALDFVIPDELSEAIVRRLDRLKTEMAR